MGIHENIAHDRFPAQGSFLKCRARVCFNYDLEHQLSGTVVRDDAEAPFLTIIALDNGRHVMATECQWSPDPAEDGQ